MEEGVKAAVLSVEFEEEPPRGRFVLVDDTGSRLGFMSFSRARDDLIIIDHTEVDESLRGQQGGRRLFDRMVAWARETDTKVSSVCPFASSLFDRTPEAQDVLG